MPIINGTNNAETLTGSTADDEIIGLGGNDSLIGGGGGDTLNGGAGNDTLVGDPGSTLYGDVFASYAGAVSAVNVHLGTGIVSGGDGSDVLINVSSVIGSDFGDTLAGNSGLNFFLGGLGNDTIIGNGFNAAPADAKFDVASYETASGAVNVNLATGVTTGAAGTDSLVGINAAFGSNFADTLLGSSGDNGFVGLQGNDTIDGAAGFDVVGYEDATAGVNVNLTTGLATGGSGSDTLLNIEGVFGGDFNDTLTGNAGNNILGGEGGNDSLIGNDGNDTLEASGGSDTLTGGSGSDTFSFFYEPFNLNAHIITDFQAGVGGDNFIAQNSPVSGNLFAAGYARLVQSGVDTLVQADEDGVGSIATFRTVAVLQNVNKAQLIAANFNGNDPTATPATSAVPTSGPDSINGTSGNDTLLGLAGNDSLSGLDGDDSLDGGVDNDQLRGDGGNDSIVGGDGNDYITGGAGNDLINGGAGLDTADYFFSSATAAISVTLVAGAGTVTGGDGVDTLSGIENINGTGFNDSIVGDAGVNRLEGQAGNDTIRGGDGGDEIIGGQGNDLIDGGANDFNTAADYVDYSSSGASVNVDLTNTSTTGGTAVSTTAGNDTLISIDGIGLTSFNDTFLGSATDDFARDFGGDDSINGAGGYNIVDYRTVASAITANLSAATGPQVTGGSGNDTLVSIADVRGTAFNDSFVGNTADNSFRGRGGNDTLDGGAGSDRADYFNASGAVTVNLATGTATGADGNDVLISMERVRGSNFNDSITGNTDANKLEGMAGNDILDGGDGNDFLFGGDGEDYFVGGAGNDSIDGGNNNFNIGNDFVDYSLSGAGVNVDLTNTSTTGGTAVSTMAGNDTLISIDGIGLTSFNDTFLGSATDDFVRDLGGDDSINGAGGYNIVDYRNVASAITANLSAATGPQVTGGSGNDTLTSIADVRGTAFNDSFLGNASDNSFRGRGGNDTLNGGGGSDRADYLDASAAVTVNLATGTATGAAGDDVLISIERVRGSNFNDSITGGIDADSLDGGAGDDTLRGGDGGDYFQSGAGNDLIDGGNNIFRVRADYVDYVASGAAVNIDLTNTNTTGGIATSATWGIDTLISIDGVGLTSFNDTFLGSSGDEFIRDFGGDDLINGAAGYNVVDYENVSTAINVNFAAISGPNVTGGSGNDTLVGISDVRGTALNDSFVGNAADNTFRGRGGDDTLNGGAGNDRADYRDAAGAVTVNLITGTSSGAAGNDVLISIERIVGSGFNDSLTGNAENNEFDGQAGNDTLDGGAGVDWVWYGDAAGAVQVDLQAGTATGGAGADSLISIEQAGGSNFADSLLGSTADNYFRGNGGADTIDGRAGFDVIDYRDDAAGVTVNFATGTAKDGTGATDTLTALEEARGSQFNDSITGSTNLYFERFEGAGGNDTIDGGLITDTLNTDNGNQATYQRATAAVTANLATGAASGGAGNDVLININELRGSDHNDTLIGSNRSDVSEFFDGRAGNDSIDGAGGFDTVGFGSANAGVTASLVTGTATGAGIGTDIFVNIEGLIGTAFNDSLTGGLAANGAVFSDGLSEFFRGGAGNDTIDGGQGYDLAAYNTATAAVVVTLNDTLAGTAADGEGGTDVLRNIEGVRGSKFNDSLTGSNTALFESFEGREGNDSINGNGGVDRADYQRSRAGVNVDLTANTASQDGYGGTDTLLNIENVRGSRDFNDTIAGSGADNRLEGLGGNDSVTAMAGNDTVIGGDGNDTLDGGMGLDTLIGGAGNDSLVGGDGIDAADFSAESSAVSVILYAGQASGVSSGTDVLVGVENIIGSAQSDLIYGSIGDNLISGGLGGDTLDGAEGADTLLGAEGADLLNGLSGADSLVGGLGNDSLYGWADNDRLLGESDDDKLFGGAGADSLDGGIGLDQLEGDDGNDTLTGGVGNDTLRGWNDADQLFGGDDNDQLFGGAGADSLDGAAGQDQLEGDDGNDTLSGGTGNDTLRGWNDNDQLVGGDGNDLLVGWSGNDSLQGGLNDDQLFGDDGADTLAGGAGGDVLQGGLGNDRYIFEANFGFDGVLDYDYIAGNVDVFEFTAHAINQLSFSKVGNALKVVEVANSANTIFVNNWYEAGSNGAFVIESWQIGGVSYTSAQIQALVI
jgi:Ca2+-binding RTX toxin-like protein